MSHVKEIVREPVNSSMDASAHDFGWALQQMSAGKLLAREGHGGSVYLARGGTFAVKSGPLLSACPMGTVLHRVDRFEMLTDGGLIVPWMPAHGDLLGDDWWAV